MGRSQIVGQEIPKVVGSGLIVCVGQTAIPALHALGCLQCPLSGQQFAALWFPLNMCN